MLDNSLVRYDQKDTIDINKISSHKSLLYNHPIFVENHLKDVNSIETFMNVHVYAVWDFMSLVKYLQMITTSVEVPWKPSPVPKNITRFVNEIVLDEESDISPVDGQYMSHFDLYLKAMDEMGCNTLHIQRFINEYDPMQKSKVYDYVPNEVLEFVNTTFGFIETYKPHVIASAFAFGRETIIPSMFQKALHRLEISSVKAPYFHFYLERHIEVDSGSHGDYSKELVDYFCEGDKDKIQEAEDAAIFAIEARMKLWDFVLKNL